MLERKSIQTVDLKVSESEVRYHEVEMELLSDDGCPNFSDDE